jgi:transposase
MSSNLTVKSEQINDIPLLVGILTDMGIREIIDEQVKPHKAWQGISVGTLVVIWLCYMLTEQDHRMVMVRDWVNARRETFNHLLGIELRETDCTDDRLANALTMVGEADIQHQLDAALLAAWVSIYALPRETIRLDSTSVSVYQEAGDEDSLLQHGHSKDHRPDLAQFKLMLATLDPLGLPLSCQVVGGQRADDGLYLPAYQRAVEVLGTRAVLVVGDSKMAALGTRGYLISHGSDYLSAYRPPRGGDEIAGWIEEALRRPERWQTVERVNEQTGELESIAVIDEWEREQHWAEEAGGHSWEWSERVLLVRSTAMQTGLLRQREAALHKAMDRLEKLNLPPKRGQKVYRSHAELADKVAQIVKAGNLTALLQVELAEEPRPDGTLRWRVASYQRDEQAWEVMTARLGWQVYVTSASPAQLEAPAALWTYRHQVRLEHGFSRLKTRHLNIRPLYLRDEQRIVGLTWVLCLALRVLTLTEFRLRAALQQRDEELVGLNPASRTQATARPTTERVLRAFQNITLSIVDVEGHVHRHISPLNATQQHVISLLSLPADLYSRLTSQPP